MNSIKPKIKKILFITPSNVGDVFLTLPAVDCLKENFPQSRMTVMAGPLAREIFEGNPFIHKFIVYDKRAPLSEQIRLFFALKKEGFDLVVDLRNTLFGALLPVRFRTSPFLRVPHLIKHKKEQYLHRTQKAMGMKNMPVNAVTGKCLFINQHDIDYVNGLLEKNNIKQDDKIIIIAPAAGGANRRWEKEKFAQVAERLGRDYKVILAGRESDKPIARHICGSCKTKVFDFSGLTTLKQLAYLVQKASLVIVCDTGVLQLASYLDVPILALFGASDEKKFGPWSHKKVIISRELFCRRCEEAQCRFGSVDCMRLIKVDDVLRRVENILSGNSGLQAQAQKHNFKRILIVRTDRIGDVLLSTPVIRALRDAYPNAYIAMMVSPYAKDIIDGNPYLDEVIIYDKDGKHKSWQRTLKFASRLKKKRFDLALVLHPTNRAHLVVFFAAIPRRVGYGRKMGFLLTDRIKHTKQLGQKHELEYNLDLLRYLDIEPRDKSLHIPIKKESEEWVDELFREVGIDKTNKLLAIHPSASCPSKVWPAERFSKVADKLAEKYGFKVLIISGPKDIVSAKVVSENMRHTAVYLGGRTSVAQLASILKRCRLFISNDSGPVHIASAVGTPVISIFGRNQKGLSPKRWGPVGKEDKILHKEVGCIECLAHNCVKSFACLKAITVDDVVNAADSVLK